MPDDFPSYIEACAVLAGSKVDFAVHYAGDTPIITVQAKHLNNAQLRNVTELGATLGANGSLMIITRAA